MTENTSGGEERAPKEPFRRYVTPVDAEEIVRLRLDHHSWRYIAQQTEWNQATVKKVWYRWLKERSQERREDLEAAYEEVVARMEQNAVDARRGFETAKAENDHLGASKYLENERRALADMSRLGVVREDAPAQAARIEQAKAQAIAEVVRRSVAEAELPPNEADRVLRAVATRMRELEQPDEDVGIYE